MQNKAISIVDILRPMADDIHRPGYRMKTISGEGYTSYLVYSSDTKYKEQEKQEIKQDSNYYSTIKYRQRLTDVFDNRFYESTFGYKPGKIRGVW